MPSPLLLLARSLLGSEALTRANPYLPYQVQPFIPRDSIGDLLARIPSTVGYMTGLKQEQPSGNLPTDYMVTPTGIVDTSGSQMVTDQGVSGFQPRDQYMMDIPYNPATDPMNRDPDLEMFLRGMPDFSRMPTGEIATSPMTTRVPEGSYQTWFNPVPQPDLAEGLPPAIPEGADLGQLDLGANDSTSEKQDLDEELGPDIQSGYSAPQVISPLRQLSQER